MKPKNEKPSAAEYGQMVAYLAKHGVKANDIRKQIGSAPNNRNRAEIVQALKEWLKMGAI